MTPRQRAVLSLIHDALNGKDYSVIPDLLVEEIGDLAGRLQRLEWPPRTDHVSDGPLWDSLRSFLLLNRAGRAHAGTDRRGRP
jgi:hypothetical protein